ncbi:MULTISPECIES: universal stress protein [unclassified Wenzhouxiangella]|uniref:universal stress protein n=1 Tax=unclassified Wenzhouxiangella TaxID=2613841 RepID=UPI0015F26524|nr:MULTISPECIES: universal stress protein [unclassified Wenzhouxiangella]
MGKRTDSARTDGLRPSRVVVLIDASPDALYALEAAVELAARHEAPLLAVSVEEPERARSAGFPFAHEVGALSGAIRRIDETLLNRRRESGPLSIRRTIETAADQAGVAWELVVVHGHLVEEVLALSGPGDLLMLGRVGWSARLGRRLGGTAMKLARQSVGTVHICSADPVRQRGRIAVLIEDGDSARAVLTAAAGRARMSGRELVALFAPQVRETAAEILSRLFGKEDPRCCLRALQTTGTGELLRVLAEERAVELVVGRGGAWLNSPAADRLLTYWRMPVLVTPAD